MKVRMYHGHPTSWLSHIIYPIRMVKTSSIQPKLKSMPPAPFLIFVTVHFVYLSPRINKGDYKMRAQYNEPNGMNGGVYAGQLYAHSIM